MSVLVYGATGYTGKLVVQECIKKEIRPTLAGRSANKVKELADLHKLNYLVFDLSNEETIAKQIQSFEVVLHLAGPFSETAAPMVRACILAGVHYVDITGELAIMQWVNEQNQLAISKGIMLLCGAGFDLVPTDCIANRLKSELPDASHLEIAFHMEGGGISHGTMMTLANNIGATSYSMTNGSLVPKPLGHKGKKIRFKDGETKFCMTIPWGDLFSAHISTGIMNIETYTSVSRLVYGLLKFQFLLNPIFRSAGFKKLFKSYIRRNITGPTPSQNINGKSFVTGCIQNDSGKKISHCLQTNESYLLTAQTSVLIISKILAGDFKMGYQTPARAYGQDLILEIDGSTYLY